MPTKKPFRWSSRGLGTPCGSGQKRHTKGEPISVNDVVQVDNKAIYRLASYYIGGKKEHTNTRQTRDMPGQACAYSH
jgi:hypothetical protein